MVVVVIGVEVVIVEVVLMNMIMMIKHRDMVYTHVTYDYRKKCFIFKQYSPILFFPALFITCFVCEMLFPPPTPQKNTV